MRGGYPLALPRRHSGLLALTALPRYHQPLFHLQTNRAKVKLPENRTFAAPPVNEVSMSVVTSGTGILDPYDVRGLHHRVPHLPRVQNQPGVMALQIAALVGGASNSPMSANFSPSRWWFLSDDETRVAQIQNDIFAYNWRRINPRFGQPFEYPGFTSILKEFKETILSLNGTADFSGITYSPSGCELFYEDIIPLKRADGTQFKLSQVLSECKRVVDSINLINWSNGWLEVLSHLPDQQKPLLKVDINALTVVNPDNMETMPVLRIGWTAGAARSTWEGVVDFFETAHSYMLSRFNTLIEDGIKETWV